MSFNNLPTFDELPSFQGIKGCAWDIWGKGDQLGTVNLLTKDVVQRAASEEIKTGRSVCLNWPIQFPSKPVFHRREPMHRVLNKVGIDVCHDDELNINTQSGSQWDGLRHFGLLSARVFYQGVREEDIKKQEVVVEDPLNIDQDLIKLGIHNWAQHGICGRGVLIDLVDFYTGSGSKELPYDPWSSHPITVKEIQEVANKQGVQFRQGDILLLRVGFTQKFEASSPADREALATKGEAFAGIEQSLEMRQFLWNNHFAAIASDQPALERWPPAQGREKGMHETLIGLWGMPIGEFFDLEALSKVAAETGRYTFFFSSWPLNILGGCASPPNAAAFF